MIAEGRLGEQRNLILLPDHHIGFNATQQGKVDQLLSRFASSPYTPPGVRECQLELGTDTYRALIDLDILVEVSPDLVFRKQDYEIMVQKVKDHLKEFGSLTVSQFRDQFDSSRKYALGFLEHLELDRHNRARWRFSQIERSLARKVDRVETAGYNHPLFCPGRKAGVVVCNPNFPSGWR